MNEKLPLPPPSNLSPPALPLPPSLPLQPIDTEGASTYHFSASQIPLEFGGTLKSSKGSKNNSNQHSPQKKAARSGSGSGISGTGINSNAASQNQCGYCACFGCCGGYGSSRQRIAMPFWPAVLANLGICALLMGYIFIGSFVFYTIENSNSRVISLDSKAAVLWHSQHSAQMPQILHQHQQQHQHQELQQQQQQQQQQEEEQYLSQQRIQHPEQRSEQQKQQRLKLNENGSEYAATHNAHHTMANTNTNVNSRKKRVTNHLAKSTATSLAAPEEVSAHISSMRKMQHSNVALPLTIALDYDVKTLPMVDMVANNDETETKTKMVMTMAMAMETETDAAADAETETDYASDDAAAGAIGAYEDATLEDLERWRTVENIWDITVSLNILYKENWTRLAALEIAKFQDQLVKRLVMDLTLSTPNGAAQSQSTTTARGRNSHDSKQQQQQQQKQHAYPNIGVNGNDGFAGAGLGNFERQRFWQSENPQRYKSHYSRKRNNERQRNRKETFEWNFPTAFLYSMTVITTVGYGTITPRTNLGRMVTIGYATLGIPLTLIYLSSIGSVLSKLLRYCCMRSGCATCCCTKRIQQRQSSIGSNSIFNRHQQVADRRTELKLKHFQQTQSQIQQQQQPLPYCYIRPPAEMEIQQQQQQHVGPGGSAFDNLSIATSVTEPTSRHQATSTAATAATTTKQKRTTSKRKVLSWSLAAPIGLCLLLLLAYITFGAVVMVLLEDWPLIDGIYFCFMSLSTIGFCDLLPGMGAGSRPNSGANAAIWFCAVYILSGLTMTSVCVNLLHDEITARMRVVVKFEKVPNEQRGESAYYSARS